MKAQSSFLRLLKDDLAPDTVVILLDFTENYSFITQDTMQGHHWDNSQAILSSICCVLQRCAGTQVPQPVHNFRLP